MAKGGNPAERIMVAIDVPDAESAKKLVAKFEGIPCWIKIGMELYYAAGPELVRELQAQGHRIFADLKLHDIPNTVKGAARSLTRLGVDMFNVHCAGGSRMLEAAREGVEEVLAALGGKRPLLIGVTQLTSTSQETLNAEIGIPGTVADAVVRYAELGQRAGLDGVVASPLEVRAVKAACGEGFATVTPGIRPKGADIGDQSRIMTPADALAAGTDFMVIGRPITAAPDPRAALETIIEELA